ncbi:DUF58 domain-containing protein [Mycobacterium sp. CVI_P3]|uniref:DUF58 domain-containing protein n=1 Tax=Mycobacterium pinniadriaticum TaxID=2994102 RepID=A0ABT3SAS1_9MYCO|nr:DUF58 domain-containing protein [Mycobacterium pinniadriaticum]MCX2930350.1 DUF58 domain-containing protein [Mycobacterium pinniadriaticum]MCX2936588.1 DUF58 domain-containing protein [Mycobacterium pinniadriaticum]
MTDTDIDQSRRTEAVLRWSASPLTRAIATCAGVALVVAVVGSRFALIAFVAPMVGVLASIGWQRRPATAAVRGRPGLTRCFENERVDLSAELAGDPTDPLAALDIRPVPGLQVEVLSSDGARTSVSAEAPRWGRYPLRTRVRVLAAGGLLTGTAIIDAADLFVFPVAPPQPTGIPRTELPDRLGTHLTRHIGPGVEFADIRPYLPGDQLRSVNWAVSARRGGLHVTERLTDRAADVVVLVDLSAQPIGPATAATERALRGATQVVQTALRNGDRAGIVGLGGRRPRWLGADIGRRQFYRVLDAALGVGSEYQDTAGTLAPRAAVPPGAVVVGFSTMLDTEFALALIDLCKRGHPVVAVDVLEGWPFADDDDPILERMWALQRSAMYRDMKVIGVDVVSWPAGITLDQAMSLVPDRVRRPS